MAPLENDLADASAMFEHRPVGTYKVCVSRVSANILMKHDSVPILGIFKINCKENMRLVCMDSMVPEKNV